MIDVLFGIGLTVVVIRGWMRGLVRQSIEIAVVLVGIFLGFRLSRAAGSVFSGLAGTSPTTSRIIGGIVVFTLVSVVAALASRLLHWGVRALPGLTTLNRVGGASAAGIIWIFLASVVLTLLSVLPTPESIEDQLDRSAVTAALTEPDGFAQRVIAVIGGDQGFASAVALERLLGTHDVVAAAPVVTLPRTAVSDLTPDEKTARKLFDEVNRERVASGFDPLAWSNPLGDVAAGQARRAYRTGRIERLTEAEAEEALVAASIPVVDAAQSMALAPTREALHAAMVASAYDMETMHDPGYSRLGVAVVRGPYGLLATYLFSG